MVSVPPLAASAHPEDHLRPLLAYAVLAPSSHNSQPWRFIVDGPTIAVCADRVRALPVIDPFDRELIISCGAALLNLRVALDHAGLAHTISTFPSDIDPDLLAMVRVCDDGYSDASLGALFDAIPERVTTRAPFESTAVPDTLQRELIAAGVAEGAEITCVDSIAHRARVAELVAEADQEQFADPRFRRELASWIDPRRHVDGMPAFAAGVPTLLDFAAPVVTMAVRTFDLGDELVMERVLLVATRAGFTASYLNQPIETAGLRAHLRHMLGLHGEPR